MDFAIGSIGVAALIVGIVEAAKGFGIDGKASKALALGLGVVLTGIAYGITQGLIPEAAMPWIVWIVVAVAGGLSAIGYYDLGKRYFVKPQQTPGETLDVWADKLNGAGQRR